MKKLKAIASTFGQWILKSFRGLICEQKNGGWELSKGAVMSWILFYQIYQMGGTGTLPAEWVVYTFSGLMGYNAFKLVDMKGVLNKK
jgi:hypothetical protein